MIMNFELHTCCIQFIQDDLFYIGGSVTGSPINYRAHTFNPVSGIYFNITVRSSSCVEGNGCPIELPATYCSQSTIFNITISAANKLGEGPHSNPFMIGKLVHMVIYNNDCSMVL